MRLAKEGSDLASPDYGVEEKKKVGEKRGTKTKTGLECAPRMTMPGRQSHILKGPRSVLEKRDTSFPAHKHIHISVRSDATNPGHCLGHKRQQRVRARERESAQGSHRGPWIGRRQPCWPEARVFIVPLTAPTLATFLKKTTIEKTPISSSRLLLFLLSYTFLTIPYHFVPNSIVNPSLPYLVLPSTPTPCSPLPLLGMFLPPSAFKRHSVFDSAAPLMALHLCSRHLPFLPIMI